MGALCPAMFSAESAHVIDDPDLGRPVTHAANAAIPGSSPGINAIVAAKQMPVEAGATTVVDLGTYDFSWWARLDGAGCRLATRVNSNTPPREPRNMRLAKESDALADRLGFPPARRASNRGNPLA